MDLNDPFLQADGPCSVRLHVGGLGSSVISSDLVQIFSSLAKVSCVDLVRTKGRNFAYVTIEAASQDIKRLFSLYNGCMWKGGRLKLEKAREFYLDKLHREWADRDCLQDMQTPKLNCLTTTRSVMKSKDSSGFSIYIPKLKKVKTIPEKGLGKHKRSFQRVDPLPYSLLQICNCDQHCPTISNYQSRTRKETSGVTDEEGIQDLKCATIKPSMNETSTECEPGYKAPGFEVRKGFEKKAGVYWKSGNGRGTNEVPDCDKPVLNIKGGTSHSEKCDTECITDIDEPVLNITGYNKFYLEKKKNAVEEVHAITKEQVQACVEEAQEVVEGVGHVQRKRLKPDLDTWVSSENKQIEELGKITDLMLQRGETNESKVFKNSPGRSWVQKASWKSLVGETGRMSFSLGSMLDQNLTALPIGNLESTSKELGQLSMCEELSKEPSSSGERMLQTSESLRPFSNKSNELKQIMQEEKLLLSKSGNGDYRGRRFMKSNNSEQDWLESKQAVKVIVKRSRKDALKGLKGLHTKQKHLKKLQRS